MRTNGTALSASESDNAVKTKGLVISCFAAVLTVSVITAVQISRISDTSSDEYCIPVEYQGTDITSPEESSLPAEEVGDTHPEDSEPEPLYDLYTSDEGEARQVDFYTLVEGIYTTAPTDGSYYSVQRFESGAKMQLVTDEEISSLYLIWNNFPGSFRISVDGWVYNYDGTQFLHQYIVLPEPGHDIVLIAPDRDTELCDIYAFTKGTPPDWVQQWRSLEDGEYADIMLFPTHADDEFLFFGGIIPLYAGECGLNVQVVYMNRHVGYDWNRNHELLNGLWVAGDDIYPVINQQDDAMFGRLEATADYYGYDNFTGFQVEQIRRYKPLVIVGHDFNGEYGHKTHIFNANCLADAVELACDESAYPDSAAEFGTWDTPKFYVHLWKENQISLDYETPLAQFGGMTAAEVAEQAYGYHYSQQIWYPGIYLRGAYDSHLFGLFRSTAGDDVMCIDLLENTSRLSGGTA